VLLVVLVLVLVLEVWECVRVFVSGVVLVLLLMLTQILFGPMVVSSLVVEAGSKVLGSETRPKQKQQQSGHPLWVPRIALISWAVFGPSLGDSFQSTL
jgi:hypothetical protein